MVLLIKRVYSGFLTHSDEASLAVLIASLAVATETGRPTETLTQRLKPFHGKMKSIKKMASLTVLLYVKKKVPFKRLNGRLCSGVPEC